MSITLTALQKQRTDTAANWTSANPTLLSGELGFESDTGKMKLGNGSAAWNSLAYLILIPSSGVYPGTQLIMPAGTNALPSLTFVGDTNTGIYSSGADEVSVATAGTNRFFVGSDGRIGMGVQSPDRRLVIQHTGTADIGLYGSSGTVKTFINASATNGNIGTTTNHDFNFYTNANVRAVIKADGKVGIGTSAPSQLLTLQQTSAGSAVDCLFLNNSSISNGTAVGISFGPNTANDITRSAIIRGINESGGAGNATGLGFFTNANGAAPTQKVTITSGGSVGIGSTAPTNSLEVAGTATSNLFAVKASSSGDCFGVTARSAGNGAIVSALNNAQSDYEPLEINGEVIYFQTRTGAGTVSERARIDSSGRLLVGTSSARSNVYVSSTAYTPIQQIESSGSTYSNGLSLLQYSSAGYAPILTLGVSASNTAGTNALIANGSDMGIISFVGNDGTNFREAARIQVVVDGAPGAGDMPGRLVFSTTADGASSPTERMRISQNGDIILRNLPTFYPFTDNAAQLGGGGTRFTALYAVNGTIQTSDQREKTEITDSLLGSDFIKSLRPVSYKWIDGGNQDTGERDEQGNYIYKPVPGVRTHWGFIAQEVKQSIDAAGVDFGGWVLTDKDDPDSQQALRYDQFIAPLTKALQEALAEIDVLKAKVAALESA